MNIDINVKSLRLRKLFLDSFPGVMGFWVSTGSISLVLVILFFVFVHPLTNQYRRYYKDMEDISVLLERYALKKDLYNNAWISSKNLEADLYDKELEKCRSFLKKNDDQLEAYFLKEDAELGQVKIGDEALWKNEYVKRVSALITKLKAQNIAMGEDALPFQNWGSDIPTWEEILPLQKRFWILEALINIVIKDSGITKLERIAFRESSDTFNSSYAKIYTAIPLTFKVELQADRILFVLHEILKSEIPFVVESVSILGTNKTNFTVAPVENTGVASEENNNQLLSPIVAVVFDLYVIDYENKK